MINLNSLPNEIKINTFKYVKFPSNLASSCKEWLLIARDHQTRAKWIVFWYGKAHSLFHAVRLGPNFINADVAKAIIMEKGILSNYFAQRLLMNYGKHDPKLIELKISHNTGQINIDRINPWASDLPLPVYIFLLTKAHEEFGDDFYGKGNDMELFHFLSGGPHQINHASAVLERNMELIKDLILKRKFAPFPPRQGQGQQEEYPSQDGYENNRQLNVIARAILVNKELVNLWKQIGYYEICQDVNDLVMQGAMLILYPPTPSPNGTKPSIETVSTRLKELIDLGFQLNYKMIVDIFVLFESRLETIGGDLIKSFMEAKKQSQEDFLDGFLTEIQSRTARDPQAQMINEKVKNFIINQAVFSQLFFGEQVAQIQSD